MGRVVAFLVCLVAACAADPQSGGSAWVPVAADAAAASDGAGDVASADVSKGDPDCAAECKHVGNCWLTKKNDCVPKSDADCEASDVCAKKGGCSFVAAAQSCRVTSDEDCLMSQGCAEDGACKATFPAGPHNGACTQGSDADCKKSPQCKQQWACSWNGSACF